MKLSEQSNHCSLYCERLKILDKISDIDCSNEWLIFYLDLLDRYNKFIKEIEQNKYIKEKSYERNS